MKKRPRYLVAALAEVLVWAGGAFGIWMLTLSAISLEEIAVAAPASFMCGSAACATRRALRADWSLNWRAVEPALVLPASIVADCAQLFTVPLRPRHRAGTFEEVDTGAKGSSPRAAALRALAGIVICATPGTVVVEADVKSGRLTVHSLGFRGPHLEERFASAGPRRSAKQ